MEEGSQNIAAGVGLLLRDKPEDIFNKKCIICQTTKTKVKLTSTAAGVKRIREAAEIRQDKVFKRLKLIQPDEQFTYHVDNDCYKKYTLQKSLNALCQKSASPHVEDESDQHDDTGTMVGKVLRTASTSRPPPRSQDDSRSQSCMICNHVTITEKGSKVRTKFRICEEGRAANFLAAASYFQDDVFNRVADIDCEDKIFAADIFAHANCIKNYILRYERESESVGSGSGVDIKGIRSSSKFETFNKVKQFLDPLLENGYGVTLSEIRDMMNEIDEMTNVKNNEVKMFLVRSYGDRIQFCPSVRQNEPLLVFSSDISSEDLAKKIRSYDAVRNAGAILREAFLKVDFNLGDKFCDAQELSESWQNTKIPDVVMTFFGALFGIRKSTLAHTTCFHENNRDNDDEGEEDDGIQETITGQAVRMFSLFQIIFYNLHKGARKTPLHMMTAHNIYDKCKSKELITSMNRIGVSTSYSDLIRSRNLLSSYAVRESNRKGTPMPSHFHGSNFTLGAFDNFDFEDCSSVSGTSGTHDTAMVLFQVASKEKKEQKPNVSSTNIDKRKKLINTLLPCQQVTQVVKPTTRPQLSDDFRIAEDIGIDRNVEAKCVADDKEFLITLSRFGLPSASSNCLPTWGGVHALISQSSVPVMKVGFLPVIPSPVTDYSTVYSAMRNFQDICKQLEQPVLPIFCDEGVFHTVCDIVLHYPGRFSSLYPMMGMFHLAKVVLRCLGKYITGSGIEDALIEAEIFGVRTVQAVLSGSHYVRSLKGMFIVSDVIDTIIWDAFWKSHSPDMYKELILDIEELNIALQNKDSVGSHRMFTGLLSKVEGLKEAHADFVKECCTKSEVCKYWSNFLQMVGLLKNLLVSDREGNWDLHVLTLESLLPLFCEFDCINYLRYASWYLERVKVMKADYPFLFDMFSQGCFVVRENGGPFNAVSPDMKLEQTIQRSQKSAKGIIGQTRKSTYVCEWQLVYHEVLAISNVFRQLTNQNVMSHSEVSHHELTGKKADHINSHVAHLLEYMQANSNPFIVTGNVPLHNFNTKQLVERSVAQKLLNVMEHGTISFLTFRKERFISKEKRLTDRISKVNLPRFNDSNNPCKNDVITKQTTPKEISKAQKTMEIAKERGASMEYILAHDLLQESPLFDGDATTKPVKHVLVSELQKYLDPDSCKSSLEQSELKTAIITDSMSQIRMMKISQHKTFGEATSHFLDRCIQSCHAQQLHLVFDSYVELSVKEMERMRRSAKSGFIELADICDDTPIPQQLDKFWSSSVNKVKFQRFAGEAAMTYTKINECVLSGMILSDGEVIPASLVRNGRMVPIPELNSSLEEADLRLIPHMNWATENGATRLVVLSNDTDVVVLILRYIDILKCKGLKEVWIHFGTGEKRRFIPLHILADKLGPLLCKVLVKSHIASGDDVISKIGTKLSALRAEPQKYLLEFAESDVISDDDFDNVESYLVRVWSPNSTAKCFDTLRYHEYRKAQMSLNKLPPTSNSIRGHILRAFWKTRVSVTLLGHTNLLPQEFGWSEVDGIMVPLKYMKELPDDILTVCGCQQCKTARCKCRKASVKCSVFCKCENKCCNTLNV